MCGRRHGEVRIYCSSLLITDQLLRFLSSDSEVDRVRKYMYMYMYSCTVVQLLYRQTVVQWLYGIFRLCRTSLRFALRHDHDGHDGIMWSLAIGVMYKYMYVKIPALWLSRLPTDFLNNKRSEFDPISWLWPRWSTLSRLERLHGSASEERERIVILRLDDGGVDALPVSYLPHCLYLQAGLSGWL